MPRRVVPASPHPDPDADLVRVQSLPSPPVQFAAIASSRVPHRLAPLIEDGIVDAVIRSLKSGKEATVYLVRCGTELRCAKVYKQATERSFRQAVVYQEGRRTRSSRRARAMEKGTRYGRVERENAWQSAEVDALYRLAAAGVRVPRPYGFFDGVLLMELIADQDGDVAPRLAEIELDAARAREVHALLVAEVVRMLCEGLVHGDLSEFNILMADDGPVIIDLPQAVDAAANNHALGMLERDVANLRNYFGRFAPELLDSRYGEEIRALFEAGELRPDTVLSGRFERVAAPVDLDGLLQEIEDVRAEAERRSERLQAADDTVD